MPITPLATIKVIMNRAIKMVMETIIHKDPVSAISTDIF
jgi:hypothetical protein